MTEGASDLAAQVAELRAKLAQTEREVERARYRTRGLVEAWAPDAMFVFDRNGVVRQYEGPEELLLVPRDKLLGSSVTDSLLPPHVAQEILQRVRRCFELGKPQVCRFEVTLPMGVRQQEMRFACLDDDEVVALAHDQTAERERSRASRRALAEEQDRILASLRDWVWSAVVDAQGQVHYRYVSPAVERLTGRPPSFFLEVPDRWRSIVHPQDQGLFESYLQHALHNGGTEEEAAYRITLPSGEVRWMNDRVRVYPEGEELLITGVVTDITEARLLDQRLRESQQLEALGVLAGGIAHDFNNILVGVLGGAETAAESLPAEHPAQEKLAKIVESSTRAAELCQQMLTYAGKASVSIQPVDVGALVNGMSQLLGASVSKQVQLQIDSAPDLPPVEADAPQLRQLLLSLVKNASDAAEQRENGYVTVSIDAMRLEATDLASYTTGRDAEPGDYLLLTVADNGPGMDTHTQGRMFEPFFTTKESGHGLGLAAALGVVRAHRGALQVRSTLGQGTRITVALPATETRPTTAAPEVSSCDTSSGGGVILLVDDEDTVLFIASTILESEGYQVRTANSGKAGIELFQEIHREVRLVVLDMTMPGLSGGEVYHALRAIDPEVPVLLSSGYSEQDALGELTQQDQVAFLHKPYRAAELRAAVSETARPVRGV